MLDLTLPLNTHTGVVGMWVTQFFSAFVDIARTLLLELPMSLVSGVSLWLGVSKFILKIDGRGDKVAIWGLKESTGGDILASSMPCKDEIDI